MVKSLVLTVTRQCNLRCSYCPTAKDGWPSLSEQDARQSVRLFSERFGGGTIKIFGGEPLLVPEVVRAALDEAHHDPKIRWVYLSTNGLGLDDDWLQFLSQYPKAILTISMDGLPTDHRGQRRAVNPDVPDTYDHVVSLLPQLLKTPRVVVTQTIAPSTAKRAVENFSHLAELGFWRFNFLPGYYIPWREEQIDHLQSGFSGIGDLIIQRWKNGQRTYVRNLFTWAPTPFFNTGLVVDADRTIHPSNVGLSGALDHLREQTQMGDLDDPPTEVQLSEKAESVNNLLQHALPEKTWNSTLQVDAELSAFCKRLYPHWIRYKRGQDAA